MGSNHRLIQVYKASMETSSKRPKFNSGRSTKDCSIPGTFTGTCEANYGNVNTIKGKEFKHTSVKSDQKKCF